MALVLSTSEYAELWEQHSAIRQLNSSTTPECEIEEMPTCLGQGQIRSMELAAGVWLDILDIQHGDDVFLKVPVHEHLVQSALFLSGQIYHEEVYLTLGGAHSYLSGSGLSPSYTAKYARSQRLVGVSIHFQPEVLAPFLCDHSTHQTDLTKLLIRDNDWKTAFFPNVTPEMRQIVQQILKNPLHGSIQRLYLQAKVFELLALQLNTIAAQPEPPVLASGLRSSTIARIHHAREILTTRLENPPSLLELAQQVGVSDRTLRRGFQELFGVSVIGYLTQQRMQQAEHLLRQGNYTVAEVANRVGYAHLGHFADAFKRQFGITPRECLAEK